MAEGLVTEELKVVELVAEWLVVVGLVTGKLAVLE